MVPLSVPEEDRRIVLRSFWFLISASFAVVASICAWAVGLSPWITGAIAFLAAAFLPLLREQLARRLYHAWNNRIVRPLSNMATGVILRVCLFLIFAATGRAGSRLQIQPGAGTMWVRRDGSTEHTTVLPFGGSSAAAELPNGWIRAYVQWAMRSGNAWALLLIPFFCMLRMVSTEEPAGSGENIYTLF